MHADPADLTHHQKLLDDHRELKALMERIDQVLDTRSLTIAEAGKLLGELGDRLIKHFAFEEEGGYFGDALLQAPRLVSRANDLLAQHPKMCRQADKLCQLAMAKENSERWWQTTAERFRAFKEELLLHEQQENGLIQEAYHQDIGDND